MVLALEGKSRGSSVRLAHITPVSLLSTVPKEQRTHLVLSELALSSIPYYAFYATRAKAGDFIILDNPVHEDQKVTVERWIDAVGLIHPDVAVIPDVIDSALMTLDNAREAVSEFTKSKFEDIELMAVPHGETQEQWLRCARNLAKLDAVSWFGISLERRLEDDQHALLRRRERVRMMLNEPETFGRIKLHLLGVSERGDELGDDKIWRRASSADTSKYVVWSMLGTPVRPPVPVNRDYPGRKPFGGGLEFFYTDRPAVVSETRMRRNLRQWVNYAQREQT